MPVELPFFLPADWASMGQNFAQDTRCAAVGNRVMSVPISVAETVMLGAWKRVGAFGEIGDKERQFNALGYALFAGWERGYPPAARMGHQVTLAARRRGAIVRPLGDVVVLLPPLAITEEELRRLVDITATLESVRRLQRLENRHVAKVGRGWRVGQAARPPCESASAARRAPSRTPSRRAGSRRPPRPSFRRWCR